MLELLEGSLDGEAFQYYEDLPFRELQAYGDLCNGLEQRFGQRVSSKARRAELQIMHQDSGEDLYKYSSRNAKIAAEEYPDLPLHQRAEWQKVLPRPSVPVVGCCKCKRNHESKEIDAKRSTPNPDLFSLEFSTCA